MRPDTEAYEYEIAGLTDALQAAERDTRRAEAACDDLECEVVRLERKLRKIRSYARVVLADAVAPELKEDATIALWKELKTIVLSSEATDNDR